MKTLLALLMFVAPLALARSTYTAVKKTVLDSDSEAVTVQLPAGATKTVAFRTASVYCSVECEFTVERNGTAATATSLAVNAVNGSDGAARAYSSSNVGTGTVIGRNIVPAGGTTVIELEDAGLIAGQNLTIRTASITGTAIIVIKWFEQ